MDRSGRTDRLSKLDAALYRAACLFLRAHRRQGEADVDVDHRLATSRVLVADASTKRAHHWPRCESSPASRARRCRAHPPSRRVGLTLRRGAVREQTASACLPQTRATSPRGAQRLQGRWPRRTISTSILANEAASRSSSSRPAVKTSLASHDVRRNMCTPHEQGGLSGGEKRASRRTTSKERSTPGVAAAGSGLFRRRTRRRT